MIIIFISKHYGGFVVSAFLEGLFFAIQSKIGFDVSPTGIGLVIFIPILIGIYYLFTSI